MEKKSCFFFFVKQIEKCKNPSSVDIQKVLLDMREYRMGLIQTPDQLRFSYMAVIEGAKLIPTDNIEPQVTKSHCCQVRLITHYYEVIFSHSVAYSA